MPHSWLLDRWVVSLATVPSTAIRLPGRSIRGPHSSRRGREQHQRPPLTTWHCLSFFFRTLAGWLWGRLVPSPPPPPPPSVTFRTASELIRALLQPSLSSPKATPWCQCIVVITSNDKESVFWLWVSLEKFDGRSRSVLTHIDIWDDRSGIPRDVGGRFGRSEAQQRVLSSLSKIVRICDGGTDHQPQTTCQQWHGPQPTGHRTPWMIYHWDEYHSGPYVLLSDFPCVPFQISILFIVSCSYVRLWVPPSIFGKMYFIEF